jgi:predicted DNA-binding protein
MKKRTSFSISAEVLELLKILAKENNRSQANMLEQLIRDASMKKESIS